MGIISIRVDEATAKILNKILFATSLSKSDIFVEGLQTIANRYKSKVDVSDAIKDIIRKSNLNRIRRGIKENMRTFHFADNYIRRIISVYTSSKRLNGKTNQKMIDKVIATAKEEFAHMSKEEQDMNKDSMNLIISLKNEKAMSEFVKSRYGLIKALED